MAVSKFLLISSQKVFLMKKLTLETASAVCTGSCGNVMLTSLGLRWWQHMIVKCLKEHCIQSEVPGSTTQHSVVPITSYHPLHTVQKTISDLNRVCCDSQ